ncbi:hypothetical protein ScPMuIL_018720 [Solemya velum]
MNLRKTKLYKVLMSGSPEAIMKAMMDYLGSGKNVNLRDEMTGGTLLHLMVEHGERFCSARTVPLIYMLACKDVDVDTQDDAGETGLHKVMRKRGCYRILVALMRFSTDTTIKNNEGRTAEDILLEEKPEGWEEMLHWYNKFKPGLYNALVVDNPNRPLIERLLKNWCRSTTVKGGQVISLKTLVRDNIKKADLVKVIEAYENTIELSLALSAGLGFIVRSWVKEGALSNIDVNTKDHSYQYQYPSYPEVPRPLLASAWESDSYEAVDVLMDLRPDTRTLYSNESEEKNPEKPIFFQLICGKPRPTDERITLRVFRGADLSARDLDGNTILHTAFMQNQSDDMIKALISYGVDIAARNSKGQTARDVAVAMDKQNYYCRIIDDYVIKLVKDKKFADVEKLLLHNYSPLRDITDSSEHTLVDIAKKRSTRDIYEVIRLMKPIQDYTARVFKAVDDGNIDDVKKLLSCKRYANARDKCGQSIHHHAVVTKNKAMVLYLAEGFAQSLNICDSMERSPLHYAELFFEGTDVRTQLVKFGAREHLRDTRGRTARDYRQEACGSQTFYSLQKQVLDFRLNVYLAQENFEETFYSAIREGDLNTVENLVSDLKHFRGGVSRYSNALFECVDADQQDIAKYLIRNGFRTDIWKQYERCDPSDPMCAMMECGHSMTSLKDRAEKKNCDEIVDLINESVNGTLYTPHSSPTRHTAVPHVAQQFHTSHSSSTRHTAVPHATQQSRTSHSNSTRHTTVPHVTQQSHTSHSSPARHTAIPHVTQQFHTSHSNSTRHTTVPHVTQQSRTSHSSPARHTTVPHVTQPFHTSHNSPTRHTIAPHVTQQSHTSHNSPTRATTVPQ